MWERGLRSIAKHLPSQNSTVQQHWRMEGTANPNKKAHSRECSKSEANERNVRSWNRKKWKEANYNTQTPFRGHHCEDSIVFPCSSLSLLITGHLRRVTTTDDAATVWDRSIRRERIAKKSTATQFSSQDNGQQQQWRNIIENNDDSTDYIIVDGIERTRQKEQIKECRQTGTTTDNTSDSDSN